MQPTKEIPLMGQNNNFYHQRKEFNTSLRQRVSPEGEPLFHDAANKIPLMERIGKSNITGYYQGDINPGYTLVFNRSDIHTVTEVKLRRNHAGEFSDPDMKKNGFFEVECDFIKY